MSQRTSGFERRAGDQYMTPEWVTETLLFGVHIYRDIWEPACGEGSIARILVKDSLTTARTCLVSDIDPAFCSEPLDFLSLDRIPLQEHRFITSIVTNPPYGKGGKLAEAFVRHAIKITAPRHGLVAMLLPVDWDAAKTRHDLFEDFPGHVTKITLTERIRWTNLPQSKSGPSQNHAWFIWDHARKGRDMRWLGRVK